MFLKLTKSGGRHYAQLVESFRNETGQPRQRTICTLGRLEPGGEVDKLIAALQRARGLDPTPAGNPLDGLRFEASRCAGDVWALWQLWRSLGFDDLAVAWRCSRVEVDVLGCLRAMVFNRLCDPGSKLACCAGCRRWRCRWTSVSLRARRSTSICCAPWTCSTTTATRWAPAWPR